MKSVVSQLKDKGSVTRGWIGVQIQPVNADIADSLGLKSAEGALVAEPQPDGPAVKAGIQSGDVITSVNGQSVKDARDLAKKISSLPPGSNVKLGVVSKGADKTINVTLGELPRDQRQASVAPQEKDSSGTEVPRLGLSLAPAGKVGGRRQRRCRGHAGRSRWSGRRARLPRRGRDPRCRRQARRQPGGGPQGLRGCPLRRQANHSAAREVW